MLQVKFIFLVTDNTRRHYALEFDSYEDAVDHIASELQVLDAEFEIKKVFVRA